MKIFNINIKKALWGIGISLFIALIVDGLYMYGYLEGLERKSFDLRTEIVRADKKAHDDIVLVMIDEQSLVNLNPLVGSWPWPRQVYSELLAFFLDGGARSVVFDVLFTEYRDPLTDEGEVGDDDYSLIEATAESGNVFHAAQIMIDEEDEINKTLLNNPLPEKFVKAFSLQNIDKAAFETTPYNKFYLPIRELYEVSKGVGVVEFTPDGDNVYRRTRLFRHYQGNLFPVMSMAVILDVLQPEKVIRKESHILLGNLEVPLLEDGQYLINMYKNFKSYSISGVLSSASKLLQGEVDNLMFYPEDFENKIVIIGASAVGVEDLKATAMGMRVPGVMLHASLISNVLNEDFLHVIPKGQTRLIIYIGTILLGFLILAFRHLIFQVLVPVAAAVIYVTVAFSVFENNVVIDMVPPLVSVVAVWLGSFTYLYFSEGRDKRKVRKMLGQYVSPAVLTELEGSNSEFIKAEVGSKEHLSILFSDVRGFTTMSETLPAERVVEILNRYLSGMVDIIFLNQGTLDKFIGDAIMAFWGAPIKVSNHATLAVRTSIEMTRGLEAVNEDFAAKGYPRLKVGIGVHTGDVILGNIGSEKKLDYTVIGDHVNLTSRLEGLTKSYGCEVLITESTFGELEEGFPCRVVDNVRVKGKVEPIRIYSVLGLNDDSEEDLKLKRKICSYSEVAFNHYLNRNFEEALKMFSKLKTFLKEDRVSEIFIERCHACIEEPPEENWDGVFTMTTK
ncbi:MAG: adenylate/guanylate cyclase domain-containing protein [Deltaproteobacteria bacterium]|nr:adenylate/guanylate cyclase domain-containing protein [Deltaproteobacteria bacterium]